MPRLLLAALGPVAAILLSFTAPLLAETADPDPAWQRAASLRALAGVLDDWLDAHGPYPRRAAPPRIRRITPTAATRISGQAARTGHRRRGFYDPDSRTIYLIAPWSPGNARDVSVLLHELVHHRQQGARHWYCPGAQEPDAYRLQQAWLAERGRHVPVNRIAILLGAGCTPRDIHPD